MPAFARLQPLGMTRRSLLTIGAGAIGLLLTPGWAVATTCSSILTPRQTRGPYFPYDQVVSYPIREDQNKDLPLIEANDNDLTQLKGMTGIAQGHIIYFQGQLLSSRMTGSKTKATCQLVAGAEILLWQANFSGRYNHSLDDMAQLHFRHPKTNEMIERVHDDSFQYWGKATTDADGRFQFKTILPGFYPATEDWFRPPHLHFSIRIKGYPEFVTQTYFSGNEFPDIDLIHELNAKDGILRDSRIRHEQQEQVIVEYQRDPEEKFPDGLVGSCQFLIPS